MLPASPVKKKNVVASRQCSSLPTPTSVHPNGIQDRGKQDTKDEYLRNDFNEPNFLHLPIQSSALKSQTQDFCFCDWQ